MRILIPGFPAPDSFIDNVASTLSEMGHDVISEKPVHRGRLRQRLTSGGKELSALVFGEEMRDRQFLRDIEESSPDMVLALTRGFQGSSLRRMRELGVRYLVSWWGDAPANMRRVGVMSPEWDAVFLKDEFAVTRLNTVGVHSYLLDEAMNPKWHHPQSSENSRPRRNGQLVFVGNAYQMRQLIIDRLIGDGYEVALYGEALPRWILPSVRQAYRGRPVFGEEKSRVFEDALAVINNMNHAEGDSLNCRAFEAAGAGALQIIEYRPAINRCFIREKEVLCYETYQDLVDCIEFAKTNLEGVNSLRKAAAERCLKEHTYRHRLTKIFETLGCH